MTGRTNFMRPLLIATSLVLALVLPAQERNPAPEPLPTREQAVKVNEATRPEAITPAADPDLSGTYGDVIINGDPVHWATGVLLKPKSTRPWTVVRSGATNSGFTVINSAGNKQLITTYDNRPLEVLGVSSTSGFVVQDSNAAGFGPGGVNVTISGNSMFTSGGLQIGAFGGTAINSLNNQPLYLNAWTHQDVHVGGNGDVTSGLKVWSAGASFFRGQVGIGTTTPNTAYALDVVGNANFTGTVTGGNIKAKFQDVAEWVPTTQKLTAGTVVVLDAAHSNHVIASSRPYDTTVAGVISAQPGLVLGEEGDAKALVATTGRVRVRVDATEHAIAIGDLLVSSPKSGTAMKSMPIDVGGISIHRPGTVVGKALEPLAKGEGEILVLLSLQ